MACAAACQPLLCREGRDEGCRGRARARGRNRHFRMIWSAKGGKAAVLRPTQRYAAAGGAPGARRAPAG